MAELAEHAGAPQPDGALARQRLDPRSVTAGRLGGWTFTGVMLLVVGGSAVATLIGTGAPLISWLATGLLAVVIFGGLALVSHHTRGSATRRRGSGSTPTASSSSTAGCGATRSACRDRGSSTPT